MCSMVLLCSLHGGEKKNLLEIFSSISDQTRLIFEVVSRFPHQKKWEILLIKSTSKRRLHMCKISQLITGHCDSYRFLFYLPVYHTMLFFTPSHHRTFRPATLPRSAERNDTTPPQDLWEIHSRLPPCLQNTLTPTKELFPSPEVYSAGAHLLGVTGSMRPAACWRWQVLIENQTQGASSLNLKAYLSSSVTNLNG